MSDNQQVNDGGPAFPLKGFNELSRGMSLRDYFAANASEKDIDNWISTMACSDKSVTREEARYCFADAMLKAREA